MAKGNKFMQTVIRMKESGKMTLKQMMEHISFWTAISILETGKIIKDMAKANKFMQTVIRMKESGKMTLEQIMVHINFLMATSILETGKII